MSHEDEELENMTRRADLLLLLRMRFQLGVTVIVITSHLERTERVCH